jgi:DNA-binding Lrp family transcriptional regulator
MAPQVDEKELKMIAEISRGSRVTQRQLSERLELSLGSVNLILKRLIGRGLIKTSALAPKKIEYALTSKGFAEKAKRARDYVIKTINLVKLVRGEIAKVVLEEYNRGQRNFVVYGRDDLSDIIELALKGFDYQRVDDISDVKDKNALILLGRTKLRINSHRAVNLYEKLKDIYWGIEKVQDQI